jgi:hypothetical protein
MIIEVELNPWDVDIPLVPSASSEFAEENDDFSIHAFHLALDTRRVGSAESLLYLIGLAEESNDLVDEFGAIIRCDDGGEAEDGTPSSEGDGGGGGVGHLAWVEHVELGEAIRNDDACGIALGRFGKIGKGIDNDGMIWARRSDHLVGFESATNDIIGDARAASPNDLLDIFQHTGPFATSIEDGMVHAVATTMASGVDLREELRPLQFRRRLVEHVRGSGRRRSRRSRNDWRRGNGSRRRRRRRVLIVI